ncbi:MAG: hypothetical protein HeimC2_17260 [Candidatus Heimdallarchaeota archaeon LC_2]|nr:MAG: hypothetical protein HeimC2_17260 [Candidatus Heimdallarchaeota archaeon LC_2]
MNIGYVLGPAGSGKSHLTRATYDWMNSLEYNVITMNLDPGVVRLPYAPDIDVRQFVDYNDIVDRFELGPNGGLVVAMDQVAIKIDEILEELHNYGPDYVLVDFPGQIETVAFRSSGAVIINELSRGNATSGLFLMDPTLSATASSFISVLLFGISVSYRLRIPMNYIITKLDMIRQERLDRISEWANNPEFLQEDLRSEEFILSSEVSRQIADIIINLDALGDFPAVSCETNENLELIFAIMQRNWNSEDIFQ